MDKEDITTYLRDLNDRLAAENATGTLYIVGGSAMALLYNSNRATSDIDGKFSPHDDIVRLAEQTRQKFNLPYNWINNAVTALGYNFDVDTQSVPIDVGGNLQVTVASPEFLMYMKFTSQRRAPHDIEDLRELCRICGVKSELDVYQLTSRFGGIDGALELYVEDIVASL